MLPYRGDRDGHLEDLLEIIGESESALAYLVLGLSAALEYVFPPFPGDTVTLFGAFLVATRNWSIYAVSGAVLAGSLLGAVIDYRAGLAIAGLEDRPRDTLGPVGRTLDRVRMRALPIVLTLRAKGPSCIVINRFLPGVRALLFVAAGMARLPLGPVLAYAAISALAWNGVILAAGWTLGTSWERLENAGRAYTVGAWIAVGLGVLALVTRWLIRRRKSV